MNDSYAPLIKDVFWCVTTQHYDIKQEFIVAAPTNAAAINKILEQFPSNCSIININRYYGEYSKPKRLKNKTISLLGIDSQDRMVFKHDTSYHCINVMYDCESEMIDKSWEKISNMLDG